MIRDSLKKRYIGMNKEFRFRGEEPGRLENFSDAVFALAITLLMISTTPPTNFAQIKVFVWDVIPFCICITLIILIWLEHFVFFFRYGLRNGHIVVFNTMFLIIVLFYVYPLKFLAKFILLPVAYLFNQGENFEELRIIFNGTDMSYLMIVYGIGATSVFSVLVLMYRYALKNASSLQLNEIERFDTKTSMQANFLMGAIPFLTVLIAFLLRNNIYGGMYAGFTYFLYFPVMFIFFFRVGKKRKKVIESMGFQSADGVT